ncbi:RidA family protein [Rhodocytophaga aerolata]|uniref:RidA family protein n=1 Tax=Rhodocytophaga aerolata TaxID=455078 RepID=A0ABT8RFQ2_9BACT|nr:RidA family protein [Rhodocytophaga aerolata]MDO1450936.1 RidA family protein [Rhodocytophaga aerolata]
MNTTKTQILQALADLGISLPSAPKPGGSYVSVNLRGNVAYVAIQFPIDGDHYLYTGKLGKDLSIQEGYDAARLCAINTLAQIDKYIGFEKLSGLNHLDIYYQAAEGWDEGPLVANGASELFLHALGSLGIHTRSILGVYSLPRNFSVGITASFTLLS